MIVPFLPNHLKMNSGTDFVVFLPFTELDAVIRMLCESVVRLIGLIYVTTLAHFAALPYPYRTLQAGMLQGVTYPYPEGRGMSESEFWTRTRTRTFRRHTSRPRLSPHFTCLSSGGPLCLLMPLAILARVIPTKHTVQCGRQNKGPNGTRMRLQCQVFANAIPRRKPKWPFWRPGGDR